MKHFLLLLMAVVTLMSCHHITIEDRAAKFASDYTKRYCPTPVKDMQRTDSITFNRQTLTFTFYMTLTGKADDAELVDKASPDLSLALLAELKENTSFKVYKDAGFNFRYVARSETTKDVLYEQEFTKLQYMQKK